MTDEPSWRFIYCNVIMHFNDSIIEKGVHSWWLLVIYFSGRVVFQSLCLLAPGMKGGSTSFRLNHERVTFKTISGYINHVDDVQAQLPLPESGFSQGELYDKMKEFEFVRDTILL